MWHAWERREKYRSFGQESPKKRDHSEDLGVDGRIGSEWILERLAGDEVDSVGSGQRPLAGSGNTDELSGSGDT
jgi:hypothetical protein